MQEATSGPSSHEPTSWSERVKQGSGAKPPVGPPSSKEGTPFSRPYRGARGNSQGRQSIGGTTPSVTAATPPAVAAAATPAANSAPPAVRPDRFSSGGKEEEMMVGRSRMVRTYLKNRCKYSYKVKINEKSVNNCMCRWAHFLHFNVYRYFLVFTALIEAVSCRSQR